MTSICWIKCFQLGADHLTLRQHHPPAANEKHMFTRNKNHIKSSIFFKMYHFFSSRNTGSLYWYFSIISFLLLFFFSIKNWWKKKKNRDPFKKVTPPPNYMSNMQFDWSIYLLDSFWTRNKMYITRVARTHCVAPENELNVSPLSFFPFS